MTYGKGVEFLSIDCEDLQSVLRDLANDSVIKSKQELYIPASVTEMSAVMFGYRPDWTYRIQFYFAVENGWYAVGGQMDGAELTVDEMISMWAMGQFLETKFIR